MTDTTQTPAPEAVDETAAVAAAAEPAADTAETGTDAPAEAAPAEEPKPKKTAEGQLKARIGYLTKQLHEKDGHTASLQAELEAARALLAAQGTPPAETPVRPPAATSGEARTYTAAEIEQLTSQRAAAQEFNRQADAMYDAGAGKFPDWKDAVENLNATGHMTPDLLEAAMATDAAPEVIHHLGTDLEEAARIAALPPIRKTAELVKLAARLSAGADTPISRAPAPISPLRPAAAPTQDLQRLAEEGNMKDYAAQRLATARWMKPRGT